MIKILYIIIVMFFVGCTYEVAEFSSNNSIFTAENIIKTTEGIDKIIKKEEIIEIPMTPILNAESDIPFYNLRVAPPVNVTESDTKTMYLTFDDGPSDITMEVLDVLLEEDIKATFFVTMQTDRQRQEKYNEVLKRIVDEGHTIAIHSYTHKYEEIYESVEAFLTDTEKISNHILEHTGVRSDIFRFPGGSVNDYNKKVRDDIIKEMESRGYVYFDWNIDAKDSLSKIEADEILSNVSETIGDKKHAFVLLHDSEYKEETLKALPLIIKFAKENGYSFDKITNEVKPPQF